ncbi:hypothetical protein [Streptomyces sp. NPDC002788]
MAGGAGLGPLPRRRRVRLEQSHHHALNLRPMGVDLLRAELTR